MRALLIAAALLLASTHTYAQSAPCTQFDQFLVYLQERYGEEPVWAGESAVPGWAFILLQSEAGTWTLIRSDGETACVVADGEAATFAKRGSEI